MGSFSSKAARTHSANDYELVIRSSKELGYLLETEFGGSGSGLHEQITSSAGLPPALQKKMRYLATLRNKLVHERGFDAIPDRAAFVRVFEESVTELEQLVKARRMSVAAAAAEEKANCVIM